MLNEKTIHVRIEKTEKLNEWIIVNGDKNNWNDPKNKNIKDNVDTFLKLFTFNNPFKNGKIKNKIGIK